jgi:hypothetical protein
MQTILKIMNRGLLSLTLLVGLGFSYQAQAMDGARKALALVKQATQESADTNNGAPLIILPTITTLLMQYMIFTAHVFEKIDALSGRTHEVDKNFIKQIRTIRNIAAAIPLITIARKCLIILRSQRNKQFIKNRVLPTLAAQTNGHTGTSPFDIVLNYLRPTTFERSLPMPAKVNNRYRWAAFDALYLLPNKKIVIKLSFYYPGFPISWWSSESYYCTMDNAEITQFTEIAPLGISPETEVSCWQKNIPCHPAKLNANLPDGTTLALTADQDPMNPTVLKIKGIWGTPSSIELTQAHGRSMSLSPTASSPSHDSSQPSWAAIHTEQAHPAAPAIDGDIPRAAATGVPEARESKDEEKRA